MALFILLATASGYLYRKSKDFQYENQRLIVINDSILSENLELKNALQQSKSSTVLKIVPGNFKKKENK